jgi:hypothetical protein
MTQNNNKISLVSLRNFIKTTAMADGSLSFLQDGFQGMGITRKPFQKSANVLPNYKFGCVQIGAITYGWLDQPGSATDIINAKYADAEPEYPVTAWSNSVKEAKTCVAYARQILM